MVRFFLDWRAACPFTFLCLFFLSHLPASYLWDHFFLPSRTCTFLPPACLPVEAAVPRMDSSLPQPSQPLLPTALDMLDSSPFLPHLPGYYSICYLPTIHVGGDMLPRLPACFLDHLPLSACIHAYAHTIPGTSAPATSPPHSHHHPLPACLPFLPASTCHASSSLPPPSLCLLLHSWRKGL